MLKRIEFPKKDLNLERIVGLIYVKKTSLEFNQDLYRIINFLRKHTNSIKRIGYSNENTNKIRVILLFNDENPLNSEELIYVNSISC